MEEGIQLEIAEGEEGDDSREKRMLAREKIEN